MKVQDFLKQSGKPFKSMHHREVFTAQEVAAESHVRGDEMVKVVLVRGDGEYVVAALPATYRLDLDRLRELLGCRQVDLADEGDMRQLFDDADVGAMPPLGNLYGLRTVVDRHLAEDEEIVFQAGTHEDVIRMKYADFAEVVGPEVGDFAEHV